MNVGMIPKAVLDSMASFSVSNIIEEFREVTLLGENFQDALSMNKKQFWGEYRRCLKKVNNIE